MKAWPFWVGLACITFFSNDIANAGEAKKLVQDTNPLNTKPMRIVSLDMCADQYALGLMQADQILALSNRAGLNESYFRARVGKIKRAKSSLETILILKPDAVLRTWGGDFHLVSQLKKHGIKIIQINDVEGIDQAKGELMRVGGALNVLPIAKAEARRFDEAYHNIAKQGAQFRLKKTQTILYYTPSGFSAGKKTWIGQWLSLLGYNVLSNQDDYYYLPPELFLSIKPDVYALGFYSDRYSMRRVGGRHPSVRQKIEGSKTLNLPDHLLSCNAWYSAYEFDKLQ